MGTSDSHGWSLTQMRYHEAIRRIGTALPPSVRGMLVNHRIPSMKLLGVLLLPPGWNASPSQDTHHEVTRSIRTDPLDWMLVHHRIPSMKQLLILVPHPHPPPPPGWNASPSLGSPQECVASTHLYTLGEERQCQAMYLV